MTPSSEATPRPWEVRPWKNSIGVCNPNIKDNYQSRVAECHFWGEGSHLDRKTCEANAALIVQAVNSYDESRKLLREAVEMCKTASRTMFDHGFNAAGRHFLEWTNAVNAHLEGDKEKP